ncbi:MAG: bifunctional adenosylcobinamide kinase/adenosylcobinamide-phosphate guanylyltransferase [Lachnospiraceae bacterium]
MKLIIGGEYQGKTEYAKKMYPDLVWYDCQSAEHDKVLQSQGLLNLHLYIRETLLNGGTVEELAQELIEQNPEAVIVTAEVGSGIAPMDAFERRYREQTGRVCTRLAEASKEVCRIVCGIPMVIKHA